jgi:hypothetical protein
MSNSTNSITVQRYVDETFPTFLAVSVGHRHPFTALHIRFAVHVAVYKSY